MKRNIKVTILIPALNAELNIKALIADVLSQTEQGFKLNKLVIVSDGSTDRTEEVVLSFKDRRIHLIKNKKQLGKIKVLNNFFKTFNGECLVQLDDDIRLSDKNVIKYLVKHISLGSDLICGYHEPIKPRTIVGKLAHFGVGIWEEGKNILANKSERYWCTGQIRAFSDRFIKSFKMPDNIYVSEDIYSFYYAKREKFKVQLEPRSLVLFQLPSNYTDYVKQMRRLIKTKPNMSKLFSPELIKKYETMTPFIKIKALTRMAIRKPLMALGYIALQTIPRIKALSYSEPRVWDIAKSSKVLN